MSGCGSWDCIAFGYWKIFSGTALRDYEELRMIIEQLLKKGVKIPNPAGVEIGDDNHFTMESAGKINVP